MLNSSNLISTAADVAWFGVPLITMQGSSTKSLVGSSLTQTAGCFHCVAYSRKEMEDILVAMSTSMARRIVRDEIPSKHRKWDLVRALRAHLLEKSRTGNLFNSEAWTINFEKKMQAIWEVRAREKEKKWHTVACSPTAKPQITP